MRRFFVMMTLCALAFVSCDPEPVPQPEVKEPILTLTSEVTLEFDAEGGEGVITYTLENAVEGVQLTASCVEEWVANITVGESVAFIVAANDIDEARETAVVVAYGELSFEVAIKQAAKMSNPEPEPEPEYTELPHLSGIYFDNQYGATEHDYNYSLALSTNANCYDIITGDVALYENSTYLFLDLYASVPAANYNISFAVPEGEYVLDVEDSAVAGTIGASYSSLYITNEESGVEVFFVEGSVTVTAEGIEAKLYDDAGNEYHYFCSQTLVDNSNNFGPAWAPAEQSTLTGDLNVEFLNGEVYAECYGDYYVIGKNTWLYFVEDYTTGDSFCFELLADMDAAYPMGRFPISNDLNNEQMALPGYVNGDGNTIWSWYHLYNAGSVIGAAPIVDGEIVIKNNGDGTLTVTIDVEDDLGNKLTGLCVANGAPEEPESSLSTLDGDVELVFSADNSLSYADCFGNYYNTDSYMWGLYFQNYTSKEQLYIEIMHSNHLYEMPLGTYTASDDIYDTGVLIKGGYDVDGYQAYSWYTRLATDTHGDAIAPICDGEITIEEAGDELYKVTFDLVDDRGNRIEGVYEGRMILEDFRIN